MEKVFKPAPITITFTDGSRIRCRPGICAGELEMCAGRHQGFPVIACLVNNEVCSLRYPLEINCHLTPLTVRDRLGWRVYRDSLAFLLAKVTAEIFPHARLTVEHSLGAGIFCSFENIRGRGLTAAQTARMTAAMRKAVQANLPIRRQRVGYSDALKIFNRAGQRDKYNLLRFRNQPKVVLCTCDGFYDLAHGPLAAATGVLEKFDLLHYPPGLVLQLPEQEHPRRMRKFRDQPQLFRIFQQHKQWGRMVGVHNVGMLNTMIARGATGNFIRIGEAFHEKRIGELADMINARRRNVKIILISGPSSAGKTTLAKRLAVQMQVNGINSATISLDNYYVDDADTPRDAAGQPDYEHIKAVDVPLFNRHMLALIKGRTIELPYFNFNTKRREFRGEKLQLPPGQMLIVEGIHGLNPRFTPMIARAQKFRIFISALTQLNLDANNRISTTDNRLMRRILRDYRYRGNPPGVTLRMWPSVRRGEKKWIFPFQAHADFAFNSALDYELAVLKPILAPILTEIKPAQPEYAEARRLQAFLDYFLEVPISDVPKTSILREYIGASSFTY